MNAEFEQTHACSCMTWADEGGSTCYCMMSSDHPMRYINSAVNPNADLCWDIIPHVPCVVALGTIEIGQEVTIGYRCQKAVAHTPTRVVERILVQRWMKCGVLGEEEIKVSVGAYLASL